MKLPPSAASAWAMVGQTAVPVVAAAVVGVEAGGLEGANEVVVADNEVEVEWEVALGLELQPAITSAATRRARGTRERPYRTPESYPSLSGFAPERRRDKRDCLWTARCRGLYDSPGGGKADEGRSLFADHQSGGHRGPVRLTCQGGRSCTYLPAQLDHFWGAPATWLRGPSP